MVWEKVGMISIGGTDCKFAADVIKKLIVADLRVEGVNI